MALTSDGCPICHTAHQKLPEHIEQALNQNVCPLCGEHIPETASEQTEIIAKLAKIDNNLSKIEHELEELILRQQTVEEQLDNLKKKIEELKNAKKISKRNVIVSCSMMRQMIPGAAVSRPCRIR